ncbi:MAG: glycosyltransferase [Hydrococcus sp. Prado102]|nr:glycosyltransferase [Hydrococcus sp. Prado102]
MSDLPEESFVFFSPIAIERQLDLPEVTDEFFWLVIEPTYPLLTATELETKQMGWIARSSFLKQLSINRLESLLDPYYSIALLSEQKRIMKAIALNNRSVVTLGKSQAQYKTPKTILAIIPHLNCNRWLEQCLLTMVAQTRPLDGIAVVDDGSREIPEAICRRYPQVTLLASPGRVGPYQIIQSLVTSTNYEAYLFQDADDWSTPERLAILLELMAVSGSQMVGTQEIRVDEIKNIVSPVTYPLDVNLALRDKPGHAQLHPTSLILRSAILSLGGFSNNLRFGGDTEFLLRAHFHLTIRNSPNFCYFRRKRSHSLTTSPCTGLDSPARQALLQKLKQIAYQNYDSLEQGKEPHIFPSDRTETVNLKWICGPRL